MAASNAESTVYSTGDEIAKDGRVLRIALGEALLRVTSGALWSIPVKAGTEGEAKLERLNVVYKGPSSISWRAISAGDNKVRIEATVSYPNFDRGTVSPAYGKLHATYSGNQPLPSAFTTQIKGWDNFTGNHVSAELKLR